MKEKFIDHRLSNGDTGMSEASIPADIRCPFCISDKVAYEGMYKIAEVAGVVMLPESAYIFKCRSCKKLFFSHSRYKHESNHLKIDFQEWKNQLGTDLFACLVVLCVVLNRLYALLDLLIFSDNFDKTRSTARHDRNYTSALTITFGILHELDKNLDAIIESIDNKNGQVATAVRELKQTYLSNNRLRKILTKYRDKLSSHFDLDIIRQELETENYQDIGFLKYDSQIDRDVYYEFEEISTRGFIRQFFKDEIEQNSSQGKTFEEIWPSIFSEIIHYFAEVHLKILRKGHSLVTAIKKEYDLKVKNDS